MKRSCLCRGRSWIRIVSANRQCSHLAHKNTPYEGYENSNCHRKYFARRQRPRQFRDRTLFRSSRETFRISNFINVKVIPNRDSSADKSLLRSLRGYSRVDYKHRNYSLKRCTSHDFRFPWNEQDNPYVYIYVYIIRPFKYFPFRAFKG